MSMRLTRSPLPDKFSGIIEAFEAALQRGDSPDATRYVSSKNDIALLVELLHVELEFRLKQGKEISVAGFLKRFPQLAIQREIVVDLIAAEYEFRRRFDPHLEANIFCQHYPEYAADLEPRIRANADDVPLATPVETETVELDGTQDLPAPRSKTGELTSYPAIPGYEIQGILGRGGMGIVYKAVQIKAKRPVALKMILSNLAGEAEIARFRIEAESIARLQHPNIVQVFEVGEYQGQPFFSLEFVEGGSLDKRLKGEPQAPRDSAQMVETLARAIDYAHGQGVIHRDLKPANILLTVGSGQWAVDSQKEMPTAHPPLSTLPKITDFGLARQLDEDTRQTRSGAIMGTPSYMAPEQAEGQTDSVGPGADVWALGGILYEMLTGRPPFKGQTVADTLMQVINHEPVPPSRLRPGVPLDLETICLKCLRKEAGKRYDSAGAFADDLRRFINHQPIRARPVGAWERGRKWVRRNPVLAGSFLAVTTTVVVAFMIILASLKKASQEKSAAEAASQQRAVALIAADASAQDAIAKQIEADKQKKIAFDKNTLLEKQLKISNASGYVHQIARARDAGEKDDPGRAQQILDEVLPEQRDWVWGFLKARYTPRNLERDFPPWGRVVDMAFTPDGKTIYGVSLTKLWRWDIAAPTGPELVAELPSLSRALSISPCGRYALLSDSIAAVGGFSVINSHAWVARGFVRLFDLRSGKIIWSKPGHVYAAFSGDGERLALAHAENTLSVVETESGKTINTIKTHFVDPNPFSGQPIAIHGVAIDAKAQHIAACHKESVGIWEVATGKSIARIPLRVTDLLFVPSDDRLLLLASRVMVWDPQTKKISNGPAGLIRAPLRLGNRNQIVAGHADDGIIVADLKSGQTQLMRTPAEEKADFAGSRKFVIDPTQHRLAYVQRKKLIVQDLAAPTDANTARLVPPYGDAFTRLDLRLPTNSVFTSCGSRVQAWDFDRRTVRWHDELIHADTLASPSGHRLAILGDCRPLDHRGILQLRDGKDGRRLTIESTMVLRGGMAFSTDEKYLAVLAEVGEKREVIIFDARTGQTLNRFPAIKGATLAGFFPQQPWLLLQSTEGIAMIDVRNQTTVLTLPINAVRIQFSPDGRWLLLVDRLPKQRRTNYQLQLVEAATAEVVWQWTSDKPLSALAFTPDDLSVVASSSSRLVFLNIVTGQEMLSLPHFSPEGDLAFFDDRRTLYGISLAGNISIRQPINQPTKAMK